MAIAGERARVAPAEKPSTTTGPEAAARPEPAAPQLRHEPALDGLRGLAVIAVVAFHLDRLDGGFMGVDLFFVLSGFLITSLLLVEHHQSGRVDLRRFWVRRARRLLPALFLALAAIAGLMILFTDPGQRPLFRGDALATLAYVANWHQMLADVSYWDMFNQPSPLDHAWSLAVEEQFYVVWPLVFAGLMAGGARLVQRRAAGQPGRTSSPATVIGVASLAGAAVSFGLLAWHYSPLDTNRAYFGTDSRIGPTLLGAGLAVLALRRARRDRAPAWWLELGAALALGWMAWSMVAIDGVGPAYYRGGLLAFAVAALVVIVAVTGGQPGPVGRLMAAPPLRALGIISYGVYLWHWPIIVYLDPDRQSWVPLDGVALDLTVVALSLAAAGLSYRLIEQPIRRGTVPGRRLLLAGGAATTVVLGAVLVSTAGTAADRDGGVDIDSPSEITRPDLHALPDDAERVLLVGDSGVLALGPELVRFGAEQDVAVATAADPVCTIVYPEGVVRHRTGEIDDRGQCQEQRRTEWMELIDEYQPDHVVYFLANAGMVEMRFDGEWVGDCDEGYRSYLARGLTEEIEAFRASGAGVTLLTTPYIGTLEEDSAPRTDCRNELYGQVAADAPETGLLDLNQFIVDASEEHGSDTLYNDWVHFSPQGARLVSEWLLPQIVQQRPGSEEATHG